MADALHEFLTKRAREDYRDLAILRPLIEDAVDFEEHQFRATLKMLKFAHDLGYTDKHPIVKSLIEEKPELFTPADFMVTHQAVKMAGDFGLCMAGEAAKSIDRTRPDVIAAAPNFPWASLRHLRNYYAHPARYFHDPELQRRKEQSIARDLQKIQDVFNHPFPMQFDSTEASALCAGLRLYKAMNILTAGKAQDELIPLQGTPATREACRVLTRIGAEQPIEEEVLPEMVIGFGSQILVNEVHDTLARISSFYRWRPESPLKNDQLNILLTLRNRTAHNCGTSNPSNWYASMEESKHRSTRLNQLSEALATIPESCDTAAANMFIHDLADRYLITLLGKASEDPQKYAVLEQMVRSIEYADLNDNLKNAYIQSAAMLIQRTSADRAQQFLDYILASPDADLKQPKQFQAEANCPFVVRNHIRDFMDQVMTFAASPGAKVGYKGRA